MIFARITWAVFTMLVYELLCVPLYIIGLVVVPAAIAYRVPKASPITGKLIVTAPRWLWLYGNDEDGLGPKWYAVLHPEWGDTKRMYVWAAIRNPINNLRFVKALHPPQRKGACQWITRGNWMLIYQGAFSRLVWNNDNRIGNAAPWFAVGWKYEARDEDATGPHSFGQGFGLRWVRK